MTICRLRCTLGCTAQVILDVLYRPTHTAAAAAVSHCRLHNAGIQVILDVVYNHTAELDDKHPYLISMRCVMLRWCYPFVMLFGFI
jgi:hypothetical protein